MANFRKKLDNTVRNVARYLLNGYKNSQTFFYLKQLNKKHTDDEKIRVGFIAQMPEIWDKEEPVFEQMRRNQLFQVSLIVVPAYDMINKKVGTDYEGNYFIKNYESNVIKAYNNGRWIDITNKFDYLFYQRPYDHYLPAVLQSAVTVKHAKCCYIPYGFSGSNVFDAGNTNKSFFRNMYFSFLESDHMVELLKAQFPYTVKLHHIENLGYPALAPYYCINPTNKVSTILWTPRWSFDIRIGGSTFIENRDLLFELRKEGIGEKLVFRPHPLLLGELISKKIMTEEEVDKYLYDMNNNGIIYDKGRPIYNAFIDADVLITDYSSVIIQYFLTGRPIIYCESGIELNDEFNMLKEGFYTAHNKAEVMLFIETLKRGEDPLAEKRREIKEKRLRNHSRSAELIVDRILIDARG